MKYNYLSSALALPSVLCVLCPFCQKIALVCSLDCRMLEFMHSDL